jgi:hypothetical protein
VTEIVDTNEFYLQDTNSKQLQEVDRILDDFDPEKWLHLQEPIKKDTPCVALFEQDNRYYRAKVIKAGNAKGRYQVQYTDFGNYAEVDAENIHRLSEKLLSIAPQAIKSAFAYCYGPHKKHEAYGDSTFVLADYVWEKKLYAKIVYRSATTNYVLLYQQGNENAPEKSINVALLKKGVLKVEGNVDLPEDLEFYYAEQEAAQEKKLGVWLYEQDE